MRKRQINYMIFERPVSGGKTWTRTPTCKLYGAATANLFCQKDSAEHVAGRLMVNDERNYYTVFECREVGLTATVGNHSNVTGDQTREVNDG